MIKTGRTDGAVPKVLKAILTPQHKVLICVKDTVCCGVKNSKQAFWTTPSKSNPR